MATKQYVIRFEMDEEGWWIATARDVQGCHTQGRSLRQARTRIREALSLFVGDAAAEKAELVEEIAPPREVAPLVERYRSAKDRAEAEHLHAQEALKDAVAGLVSASLTVRDAGEILGLSHQRVQQLVADVPPAKLRQRFEGAVARTTKRPRRATR
jgi:predicted RNase H-like HicB family nuclease